MKVDVYLTPVPFSGVNLENKTVIVIDVLRFCTTTCAALLAGAKGVIPTDGPGQAGEMWSKLGSEMAVLAGERGGVKIENFQLGNSPAEFTPENVGGRYVIMTTTNGTTVFTSTRNAQTVVCCALVNVSLAAAKTSEMNQDVVIVCSGQEGSFSIEDTVCAGMVTSLLNTRHQKETLLNDAASLALLLYRTSESYIKRTIQQGEHGRFLAELGFAADVDTAAGIDTIPVLPILQEGQLVADRAITRA
jgi:2-phosphosulfolactate phosphatase